MSTDSLPTAAFHATRLTSSTFLIKEYDDIYMEHPFVYVKVISAANAVIVIDTGCGGASVDPTIQITGLREFIETYPVEENGGMPLNEAGTKEYVVVLTHCHYDHILGVEDFEGYPILASAHSPQFLSQSALPEHSLCQVLGIETPSYKPRLIPHLHKVSSPLTGQVLGVTLLHTPGHTPDEVALYDEGELMLYVGDSLYEDEPIIFPKEGSIVTWFSSIRFLVSFVTKQNRGRKLGNVGDQKPVEVFINSGHCTVMKPALEVLQATLAFMEDVVQGKEKVKETLKIRGEKSVVYQQDGGRFSLRCPERLIIEARNVAAI